MSEGPPVRWVRVGSYFREEQARLLVLVPEHRALDAREVIERLGTG